MKLNRDQLYTVCGFTNPAIYEAKVDHCIQWQNYADLDALFNIIQIGEMVSKKYLYTFKKKYIISLKYSEAASLHTHTYELTDCLDPLSYEYNVAIMIRAELHFHLTNYQKRFHGQTNRQNLLSAGDQSAGGSLAKLT
ncbi:hypothetical protein QN348_01755 [Mucilaginibacter sp. 5C4]|nr:hypothetical protein [Mucilaginibacter sp. 5C4]